MCEENIESLLRELDQNPDVEALKKFPQHGKVNRHQHCENVVKTSWWLNRLLRTNADEKTLVRAAMLHDLYLYNWQERKDSVHYLHGFTHPHLAAENAKKIFHISEKERKIIESHMWPLTITKIPTSREGWLICTADKLCAIREFFQGEKGLWQNQKKARGR